MGKRDETAEFESIEEECEGDKDINSMMAIKNELHTNANF